MIQRGLPSLPASVLGYVGICPFWQVKNPRLREPLQLAPIPACRQGRIHTPHCTPEAPLCPAPAVSPRALHVADSGSFHELPAASLGGSDKRHIRIHLAPGPRVFPSRGSPPPGNPRLQQLIKALLHRLPQRTP